jgi:2-polyprenyl-3-methyl-5-hydroxy-6-metoxy-1,4-benzoquinol methylase
MRKLVRDVANVVIYRATWGGSQNFLGARWVERVIDRSPARVRERVALRFLSLSPHYFYDPDIKGEDARNRRSRQVLADEFIAPYLTTGTRVLDYGCGPGYLAAAVAEKAAHVDAVDISRGVLACARVLNARPNITYQTPAELAGNAMADVAYSFAVVQHLRTETLEQVLSLLADAVRPGGVLLLHFAVPDQVWRTEKQWRSDSSLAGRTKLHYGLNCFGRPIAEMAGLVAHNGFSDVTVRPLGESITVPCDDDVSGQHLLTARRDNRSPTATVSSHRGHPRSRPSIPADLI